MKKTLVLLLAAGLSGGWASAEPVKIGAVLSNFADKYVTYLKDGVDGFAAKHPDVELKLTDGTGDAAHMLDQVENFIDGKMDAVLMQPVDRKIVKSVGKKLQAAGIPLIVINHYPEAEDAALMTAYVGSKERQAGILQAEAIVRQLNGKPANVAILLGPLGLEAQSERTAGNKEVFDRHDNIKVAAEQEGAWDRVKAMHITEDWLQGSQGINVIAANNDEMAIGALLAAEKAGKADDDMIIAGIDATPDALDYLGKGLDITIFQDAYNQGYEGMQAAYNAARKQPIEPAVRWIDFQTVTPENKAKFIH